MSDHFEDLELRAERGDPLVEVVPVHAMQEIGGSVVRDSVDIISTPAIPEISAERAATFKELDPQRTYLVICGDDRGLTAESAEKLAAEHGVDKVAFLRYYGGLYGISRVLAVSIAAQYGPDALHAYDASFSQGFAGEVKNRIEAKNPNVKLGAHSAEDNEDSASELNMDTESGLGCAYCALLGGVCGLCQPDSPLVVLAREEQTALFGDDTSVERVTAANTTFEQHFSPGQRDTLSVGRQDFNALGLPVAILAGSHAKAADVIVAENFSVDQLSAPNEAVDRGIPFYNNDVTAVAEMLIKAFPELHLNPRVLLAVMDHDIRAVRAALASHEDESLGAADLKLERHGDPSQAIAYLEALAT